MDPPLHRSPIRLHSSCPALPLVHRVTESQPSPPPQLLKLLLLKNKKVSPRFLPRDAMRGLCSRPVSVCLSIRLSVTFVYCIHVAKDMVKLFPRLVSDIIQVFTPSADTQFQGKPLQRRRKIHRGGESCDFRLKSTFRLSRKRYEIGPWLPWYANRKS